MKIIKYFLFLFLLGACAQELEPTSMRSLESAKQNPIENLPADPIAPEIPEEVMPQDDLVAIAQTGPFKNFQAVVFDMTLLELQISAPLMLPGGPVIEIPIRQIPGAYYKLGYNPNGDYQLSIHIPFREILKASNEVADELPNGEPLPSIPGGEKPNWAYFIDDNPIDYYVYLGSSIAATFIPTPDIDRLFLFPVTLPLKNKSKTKTLGYLSIVPSKNGYDGGIFVSTKIPNSLARFLDDFLK